MEKVNNFKREYGKEPVIEIFLMIKNNMLEITITN